jgi:hypothetical protein
VKHEVKFWYQLSSGTEETRGRGPAMLCRSWRSDANAGSYSRPTSSLTKDLLRLLYQLLRHFLKVVGSNSGGRVDLFLIP